MERHLIWWLELRHRVYDVWSDCGRWGRLSRGQSKAHCVHLLWRATFAFPRREGFGKPLYVKRLIRLGPGVDKGMNSAPISPNGRAYAGQFDSEWKEALG